MYYRCIYNGYPVCGEQTNVILKNKIQSSYVYAYLIQIIKELSCDEMIEIAEWCDNNLRDNYLIGRHVSGFECILDAIAFKLRWL